MSHEGVPGVIELVEADPTWPQQFEEIGRSLRAAFGPRAVRIDHIGSTAVPGLLAKDVIDVQVTVEAFVGDDEDAYYDVKDPVFDIVMAGAEAWAVAAKWAPGPSDA